MSDRLLVATRKGLFTLERMRAGWTANLIGFVGNPVTNALRQDDGVIFAALKLGHFGPKLHRSDDGGDSWQLMNALWNVPERARWFGGGYDDAGIHSISPDPRDPPRTFVAISCGGVWETRDDGVSWTV